MRTTVTLDQDVFDAAKALAEGSGRSLGAVLSLLARRGLRASADLTHHNGLPVFKVSPNAEVIPSRRAVEMLAEEPL